MHVDRTGHFCWQQNARRRVLNTVISEGVASIHRKVIDTSESRMLGITRRGPESEYPSPLTVAGPSTFLRMCLRGITIPYEGLAPSSWSTSLWARAVIWASTPSTASSQRHISQINPPPPFQPSYSQSPEHGL